MSDPKARARAAIYGALVADAAGNILLLGLWSILTVIV